MNFVRTVSDKALKLVAYRDENNKPVVLHLKTAQKVALIVVALVLGYYLVGLRGFAVFVATASYYNSPKLQEFIKNLFTFRVSQPSSLPEEPRPSIYAAIGDYIAEKGASFSPKKK